METNFTKGEWIANIDYVPDNVIDVICDGVVIAHVYKPHDRFQLKANAKLIAAAPEMLEALKSISSIGYDTGRSGCTYGDTDYDSESAVYGYNMCLDYLREIANKAIKKATE